MNAESLLQFHLDSLNYSVDARPLRNSSRPITVWMALSLVKVIELTSDERLSVMATLTTAWRDDFMTWNPDDYDGLTVIYRRAEAVWKSSPFTLLNAASSSTFYAFNDSYPIINRFDGGMTMDVSSMFTVVCTMDILYFPWDMQTCQLQFKPSVMDVKHMVIQAAGKAALPSADPSNLEWVVDQQSIVHYTDNVTVSSGLCYLGNESSCNLVISVYYISIDLHRRAEFYLYNVIAPVCILAALSLMALLLPNSRGEQISLSVSVFLSITVFQSYVNDFVPRSSKIPLISAFLLWQIVLSAICVTNAIVTMLLRQTSRNMPHWLLTVANGLAKCLLLNNDLSPKSSEPVLQSFSKLCVGCKADLVANGHTALVVPGNHGVNLNESSGSSALRWTKTHPQWTLLSDVVNRLALILYFLAMSTGILIYLLTMSMQDRVSK